MNISKYWSLAPVLSAKEAALLMIGIDPQSEAAALCDEMQVHKRPPGYDAALRSIQGALESSLVEGNFRCLFEKDAMGHDHKPLVGSIDAEATMVVVDSLKNWLKQMGVDDGFFAGAYTSVPEYMDPRHERYSPKLHAAIVAWTSVGSVANKTPKQAVAAFARKNAAQYGLCDEEGMVIEAAIEDVAKVANWGSGGSAHR